MRFEQGDHFSDRDTLVMISPNLGFDHIKWHYKVCEPCFVGEEERICTRRLMLIGHCKRNIDQEDTEVRSIDQEDSEGEGC